MWINEKWMDQKPNIITILLHGSQLSRSFLIPKAEKVEVVVVLENQEMKVD